MTSVEKAKEIIKQGGNCNGLICDSESVTACPCADIECKESNWPGMITICEKFLERQNMQPVTAAPFNIQDLTENVNALLAIKSEEASKLPLYSDTQRDMQHVLDSMKDLLIYKNNKYGNSALEPMDVFTRHVCNQNTAGLNSILVRLDDKLKRIQNAEILRKNDISDLIGYLTLLCVDQEWIDFSEFKD